MPLPTDLAEAHALILRQREDLTAAAARAAGAEAMIAHMKLVIAKLRREQYGQSSERGRKVLDQLELQLEELEAETSENAVTAQDKAAGTAVASFTRRRPVRAPFAGPSAARAGRRSGSLHLSALRRQAGEARRGHYRDPGGGTAPMEGDPDGAREIHLPVLRENHSAAGTVPRHCPGSGWGEPVGDDPLCQIRPASAAQSAK